LRAFAQNRARRFAARNDPVRFVRFAAMASPPRTALLPSPSRLRRAGSPTAKPRRLLPTGSISPAAKPRWPVIGPTFWVCRAKSGAAFRRAKRPGAVCPLRGHGFATPHRSFAVPVTAVPRRVPNGKTPALVAIRLHFARGETARPLFPHFCPARL